MNPAKNPARSILERAQQRSPGERGAFLDGACGEDTVLRAEVERLLAEEERTLATAGSPGNRPAPEPAATVELAATGIRLSEEAGSTIGPRDKLGAGRYRLLEKIGEGGFGAVWAAEQREPVRRRVALKIIKLGMDTRQVVARFEAERQALALMDHPNIAKVLDAGATDTGRPYFVMELVKGIPITHYCDQEQLGTEPRLDLFIKVCHAIQHAHQKGIIHRDIKPSNILVTLHDGVAVPKVIDFGIAKATQQELTELTVYTQHHQFIGTPAYMSPEQAEMSGLDIDTRSDIYSLGVLLYELLTGSTPFDTKELVESGVDGMRKIIREREPVRPGTRLRQTSLISSPARPALTPLRPPLSSDLDWIVMKCLEKDRTRRYETANGLAADIHRHLRNEPVVARPPSAAYRFQKAWRRNRVVYTAGAAVVATLLIGIVATARQSILATRAKQDALSARQEAVANEAKAVEARAQEARLRLRAEAAEVTARQRAYASDMNVAMQQLAGNNLGHALDLLNRQRPAAGQRDLRGWEWRYLWQQTRSDALATLGQESSEINALTLSPDGHWMALGTRHRGGAVVWDLRARKPVVRLAEDSAYVRAAFSPTGSLVALVSSTVSPSGEEQLWLRIWNVATRQMMTEVPLGNASCLGVAFSQDGQTLVTSTLPNNFESAGSGTGKITLWRVPDGTELADYPAVDQPGIDPGTSFAASPDLGVAAHAMSGGRIRVIDLRHGRELWTTVASQEYVLSLAFSPDGRFLASADGFSSATIRLWEVATGNDLGRLDGHEGWVTSLVFWPDGQHLASSSTDQTIRIWELATRTCSNILRGHRQEVWRLALFPDQRTLISGAKDGTICLWDSSRSQPRRERITLPESIVDWGFSADGRSILTLDFSGQVNQWAGTDYQRREQILEIGPVPRAKPHLYRFSPLGRWLAAAGTNGTFQVWDLSNRALLRQWTHPSGEAQVMSFLPAHNRIITLSWNDKVLREWDLASGTELQSWQGPVSFMGGGSATPDERFSMAIGYGGQTVFHNLAAKRTEALQLAVLEASGTTFSPDGKLFAAASHLGYTKVWETVDWHLVTTLTGVLNAMETVAFTPDGTRLVTSGSGKEAVKLWDTESWQDLLTLAGQGSGFKGVKASPDGNTITWGDQLGTLHVWHAPSWDQIAAVEARELGEIQPP